MLEILADDTAASFELRPILAAIRKIADATSPQEALQQLEPLTTEQIHEVAQRAAQLRMLADRLMGLAGMFLLKRQLEAALRGEDVPELGMLRISTNLGGGDQKPEAGDIESALRNLLGKFKVVDPDEDLEDEEDDAPAK